jgi:hypothetical protein
MASDALEASVQNLLAQWEYLRHARSQAVEAIRAAAQVPLSDDAIGAALAYADAIISSARPGERLSDRATLHLTMLEYVLGGYVDVRRRASGGRALDGFEFRMSPEQRERAKAWIDAGASDAS